MKRREMLKSCCGAGLYSIISLNNNHKGILASFDAGSQIINNNKTIINKKVKMKTIGILGGIGPQATMNFEAQVHNAAKKHLPPLYNSGYPPMVVFYHRFAPILINDDLTPIFPMRPDPRLLEGAKHLGTMADFLVITSNGVHNMQKEIEQAAGRKVLSMIDITLDEVRKRQWKKVGVIGYRNALVYTSRLADMGISFETVSNELQLRFDAAVMKVMEGRDNMEDRLLAMEMIGALKAKKVEGIIAGCTEFPLLLNAESQDEDILNPSKLLAEEAVRYSLQ
jgi:aspartate racemase